MQDISIKFQGSPQKFGKSAFCQLAYTQSKLYDHVLYKDLINFKDVSNFKSQAMALDALNQHLQDKYAYTLLESNTIIETQKQEISFLKDQNRFLTNKNLERTHKIIQTHQQLISALIRDKQQEVRFMQSQKEALQNKIQELESQLANNQTIFDNIQREREETKKKQTQLKQKLAKLQEKNEVLQNEIQEMEKKHKIDVKNLNEQKLEIQLHLKKLMIEHAQNHKRQLQDLQRSYLKKLELQQEQKLQQSLSSKENLNRMMKNYEAKLEENKIKLSQMFERVQKLSKQLQYQKQKCTSLEADVKKQDDILDKYEGYLKESDQNIISLKTLLLQCQQELQKAKVSLQKNQIERDCFENRIKICEEQARMWRESYYLNKSRAFNDN